MIRTLLASLAVLSSLVAVEGAQAAPKVAPPKAADWRTPAAEDVVVIDTSKGRVILELIPEVAPGHVARFQELTREGVYDGRTFFRVIDRFMAQTGDPDDTGEGGTKKPNLKAEFTFRRDASTPFVAAAAPAGAEVGLLKSLPVVSQAWSWSEMTSDRKVSAWGTYCPGVVGEARDEGVDSANSQFFLMRQPYPSLDKRYTAFGRVLVGLDVVRAIKTGEPVEKPQDRMIKVRLLADIPANERPTVRVVDPASYWFKGEIARKRAARGADFSVCDLDLAVDVR
ncbi:peptidylprolyl isomerase [Caulobacter sp. BK020]|uniref:peptidylprolyl isomerase n=1 Tax=Caulobacter sp. BK020 TaxID=2512117 RepID=UPI001053AF3A|nr:peptidylprolyl isomerase [Caulobacter sp. BK020]TCS14980.1 peptidylprolyl isomerase [Caulobacter sp. BK020]